MTSSPASVRHGTSYRYDTGCRCEECCTAKMSKRRAARDRARAENRPSYQRELATSRMLKERYRGTCERCGNATAWAGGVKRDSAAKLCISCSREVRAWQHGTNSGYTGARCRCDDCRAAHAAYMRSYYARKKAAA